MFIRKKQKKSAVGSEWVVLRSGYEKTESVDVIRRLLEEVKKRGTLIYLNSQEYRAGKAVLINFSEKQLILSKPNGCPLLTNGSVFKLFFLDDTHLWNIFDVRLLSTNNNTLTFSFPPRIIKLQRRSHYRIQTPQGSSASFQKDNNTFTGFFVKEISEGGMQLCQRASKKFRKDDTFTDLELTLQIKGEKLAVTGIKAQVKWIKFDENSGFSNYGLLITKIDTNEKEKLRKLIRQLELEYLRKGLAFV